MIGLHPTTKVFEEVNRKLHGRNTMVQLLALYTALKATIYSITDGQTDDMITLCSSKIG